jgi:hypothetical protein
VRNRLAAGVVGALVAVGAVTLVVRTLGQVDRPAQTPRPVASGSIAGSPIDITKLTPFWDATVVDGSFMYGPQQDDSNIYLTTSTGVEAFAKDCREPCQPLWKLDVEAKRTSTPRVEVAVGEGVVVVIGRHGAAAAGAECRSDGGVCQPLWRLEAPADTSGYFAALIQAGVVWMDLSVGEGPENHVTAQAFALRCRTDGGVCDPTWTADLGTGTTLAPGTALDGVFYQQVGARILGFAADCGTGGETCAADFATDSVPSVPGERVFLYGPVGRGGELVFASGGGTLYGFREHCGSACSPLWVGHAGEYGGSPPALAGGYVVVAGRSGVAAYLFGCASDGSSCEPAWVGSVDRPAYMEFADEHAVVVFAGDNRVGSIVVFPTNCSGRCKPLWTSAKRGRVYGVTGDGSSVFAVFHDDEIRAFPLECHDPCEAVWHAPVQGDVYWILVDSDHLVAAGREGFGPSLTRLTVFHDA